MTTVTFDGVELKDVAPFDINLDVTTNVTVLLSGKRSVQTSTETGLMVAFECYTEDYSDITALIAKIGYKATLVIDGTSYTNCAIAGNPKPRITQRLPGKWWYSISFVRDTT